MPHTYLCCSSFFILSDFEVFWAKSICEFFYVVRLEVSLCAQKGCFVFDERIAKVINNSIEFVCKLLLFFVIKITDTLLPIIEVVFKLIPS